MQGWAFSIIFEEYRKFFGLTEGVEGRIAMGAGGGTIGGFNGILMRSGDCEVSRASGVRKRASVVNERASAVNCTPGAPRYSTLCNPLSPSSLWVLLPEPG